MVCKNCNSKPVYKLISGELLCKSCFMRYVEKKVRKTIRMFKLVDKKDRIAVAVSGGKDSLSVLYLLHSIFKNHRGVDIFAISIDEGIKGYRNVCVDEAEKFCKKNKIEFHKFSYKEEFGYTIDEMVDKLKMKPCTICGVLRRYMMNMKARELKAKKLATGHNLDDEAQNVIMNQFKSRLETSARLGPMTGVVRHKKFIRRIKPLYMLLEKETAAYVFLKKLPVHYGSCPYSKQAYRADAKAMLNDFELKHPGTKNGIIQSFLELLPLLKKHFKNTGELQFCKDCGEPCSQDDICNACTLLKKLKK